MMKKRLVVIGVLVLLVFGISQAKAAVFDDVLVMSETNSTGEWSLAGVVSKYDGSLSGQTATVTLLGTTTDLTLSGTEGYNGLPASPDPSAANGEPVTFTYGSHTFSARIPSINRPEGYNGVIQMPVTYNLQVKTAGASPVIAWSNDFNTAYADYSPIDQYRIRVYDKNWNRLVNHRIRSSETDLSSIDQTFDFSTIDFRFEEGEYYTIRVEAREYAYFYDAGNQAIETNAFGEYPLIININRQDIGYQFLNGENLATLFKEIYLFSDNASDGWTLNANSIFNADPSGNTTIEISDSGAVIASADIPYDPWGTYWGEISMDPAAAEGTRSAWTAEGQTVTADIPENSIIKVPVSTRLQLAGGTGDNPILSWENNAANIQHFRVRVLEPDGTEFLVDERLYDIHPEAVYTFDFNTIGFEFEPGKPYILRIEAHSDMGEMENAWGVRGAYIINRSRAELSYKNTYDDADLPDFLDQTQISQLYVSIFGRASEGEGNAYWRSNQADMTTAASTMLASPAALSYFGNTLDDDQAFIAFIYENTLGKTYAQDPDGVDFWVGQLQKGQSKGQVVVRLINAVMADGYTGLAAQAQNRFINKVTICNYTAERVTRCPDVNDLSAFVDLIKNVTHDPATLQAARENVDGF